MSNPTIEVTEGGVELPVVDVLTGRGAIFGKSGSGKSNTVGVIAEALLEQNFPLLIIDRDGEHYGLKEEYQLLHVGADDSADTIVGPEHAEALARVALDENVPIILDVSGFLEDEDVDTLVRDLVSTLFRMEKKRKVPFPIFIEEAHEFVPETNHPDETAKAIIKVAKRGRKHGLGITALSQRPANVNKDLVTQADWTIWHKLSWRNDTKVVRDVLTPEHAQAVQDLDPGEALLYADEWMEDVRSVKFKRKRTFDAGQTPGLDDFERPELQPVDDSIMETLAEITDSEVEEESRLAEVEAERDRLREEVRDLREQIEEREGGQEPPEHSEVVQDLREEKRDLESELDSLRADYAQAEEKLEKREDRIATLEEELEDLRGLRAAVEEARGHLREAQATLGGQEAAEAAEIEDEYRERVEALEAEVDRLEAENERLREAEEVETTVPRKYETFYEHEVVEDAIEAAIENSSESSKAVWGVILTIAEVGGPVKYDQVADRLGYADNTHVSKAASALEARDIIEEVDRNPKKVDFNFEGMEEIERKNRMREEMEERIEQKVS